jgi:starvation-inducible DNA-binding protein
MPFVAPAAAPAETAAALQAILADLIALSLQAKQAHWNVRGPLFRPLHEQFDELAAAYRDWADEVAERALALDAAADGRATTVAASAAVEELPAGRIPDREAVGLFLARIESAAARFRDRLPRLGEIDPVTQDTVIDIVRGLEKQAWMLRAQLA